MCSTNTDSPVIVGTRDIAAYLQRSRRVVRRMIQQGELPVALERGAYMTTRGQLNKWLYRRSGTK